MAKKTPQQIADKWKRNTQGSGQAYREGVMAVTESPTAKAAAKADKMLANLTKAVQGGKWAAGLNSVSMQEWKDKTINKGLPRINAGVEASAPKFAKFAAQLNSHQDQIKAELESMPDLTLEDNLNRMLHNARKMAEFQFNKNA